MDNHIYDTSASNDALLNCIIDESALLAGLSEDAADGIKQWINTGAINVFVPLYSAASRHRQHDHPR